MPFWSFARTIADWKKAANLIGKDIDFSSAENILVGSIDVALFAQNVAIAAESKGYGICYIGGVRNAPEEISELLSLPEGVAPMFAMTIGVPDEANEVKPRLPVEAIIHENGYNADKYDELIPEYDETNERLLFKSRIKPQRRSLVRLHGRIFRSTKTDTYERLFEETGI